MKKQLFSIALALCLCVALLPIEARADNSPTRDEAVKWLYDQEGVWHDLDNKYGAQCSDFVSAYMNWLYSGNTNPYQGYAVYNASYYPTVAGWNTGRWAVYSNTSSFAPEPGDIYVQSAHVGVFLAGSKSRATVIDQNSWETWALAEENAAVGRAGRIYDTSITDATHFIRYKNFSTAAITPTVTFTAWENSSYTYIRETDAAIGQQIDISGGTCTKTGMILYDNNRKELGRAENPSYTEHRVFFKVNEELGVTLSPGTTYQYRFWAAVNGKIYYSDYKSFKTSGTANIAVTGISVNKTTLSLKTGETASLTATVSPSNATDKTVTWSSSSTKVATVSGGKVTAVAAGTATITAKAGNKTATCTVTVSNANVAVTGISLNKTSLSLTTGESATLTATVSPSNATDKTVTWSSNNTKVATVSGGKVTAVAAGTATITANAGNKTATCSVTVSNATVAVTSISLSRTSLTLNSGDTATLTATVYPDNATDKNVVWISDNEAVATVNNGVVTAVSAGTTIIRAQAGGKSTSCTITVTGEAKEYQFEIGAYVDGEYEVNFGYYGVVDVYINGELIAPSVGMYLASLPAGTIYEIKNIVNNINGYKYDGVYDGSLQGTVTNGAVNVVLHFSKEDSTSEHLYLDQAGVSMVVGGGTVILNPSNGTSFLAGNVVSWSSSNPNVATVSEGVVTPVSAGTAIITASYQGATATCTVTVRASKDSENQDVPSSWATAEVATAISAGLVPEVLQKNYTKPVSRADVAQMFINLIERRSGKPINEFMEDKGVEVNPSAFTDTNDKAVLAANALGIIQGIGDNKFDPNGTFTRAQIAAIINRIARVLGVETEGYSHSFTDVSGHWANSELGWPSSVGIINGVGDNKFSPDTELTTEQAIAITYRALQALKQ